MTHLVIHQIHADGKCGTSLDIKYACAWQTAVNTVELRTHNESCRLVDEVLRAFKRRYSIYYLRITIRFPPCVDLLLRKFGGVS
jgi:hypothetical protein